MRKIYSTLALAACVCVSATAAEKTIARSLTSVQQLDGVEFVMQDSPMKSAPQKAASMNSFLGFFSCEYEWPFSSSDPGTTLTISAVDENQVALYFHPWGDYSNVNISPVLATVDLNAGTLTINSAANANLGTADMSDGTVTVGWGAYDITQSGRVPKDEVVGTLQSDGTIVFGGINELVGFAIVGQDGSWLGAFRDLKFVAPPYFKYVESEWESAGTASYEEYVVNPILNANYKVGKVDVALEKNKNEEGLYLLRKPYSVGGWAAVNENPESDGFIVFNIAYSDCVWLRPLVPAGLWMDQGEEGAPSIEDFYFYNLEGDYVFNVEADPEEIAEVFAEEGTECSTYDPATGIVDVKNVMFGITSNPSASYVWTNYKDLTMTIGMPAGAVEGIVNDADTAAKRYFNLQGVEIANPAEGELVIVKQGSKASKVIF